MVAVLPLLQRASWIGLDYFGAIPAQHRIKHTAAVKANHSRLEYQRFQRIDREQLPITLSNSSSSPARITAMADDTRQPGEQAAPRPRAPANIMPGGTAHTAGGEKADATPTYIDAVRSLGPEYYLNFHKRPCVRDSQLQGLPAGFAGGSLAAILGSTCSASEYVVVPGRS